MGLQELEDKVQLQVHLDLQAQQVQMVMLVKAVYLQLQAHPGLQVLQVQME
jgi:hypothetical protein